MELKRIDKKEFLKAVKSNYTMVHASTAATKNDPLFDKDLNFKLLFWQACVDPVVIEIANAAGVMCTNNHGDTYTIKLNRSKIIQYYFLSGWYIVLSVGASEDSFFYTADFFREVENDDEQKKIKEKQLQIIKKYNPARNNTSTWIRGLRDIQTFAEAYKEMIENGGAGYAPDCPSSVFDNALLTGYITVFSSYPITPGVFVTPSKREASFYTPEGGRVYSKRVDVREIAWIDYGEGQYTGLIKIDN